MKDLDFLTSMYEINSKSGSESCLLDMIETEIRTSLLAQDVEYKIWYDDYKNLYIEKGAPGKDKPCFVAHTDEVHEPCDRSIVVTDQIIYGIDKSTGERCGIGADDKNGIYVCVELLKDPAISNLKVCLFRNEETGLNGSAHASLEFFEDCRFVVQIDAPCHHEFCVRGYRKKQYIELSKPYYWQKHWKMLSTFGFFEADGGATDVCMLKMRNLKVPCAEIGAGYYSYHKDREYTVIDELEKSLQACYYLASPENECN